MRIATSGRSLALILAVVLAIPTGLRAGSKRGALVVVAKSDGIQVKGELVSVKTDSLLILRGGDVLTIPRHKVHSVTLMRRSRMASSALKGFIFGALPGVAWGISYGDSVVHGIRTPVKAGAVTGILGLAIGMAVSRGEKAESVIPFAGLDGPAADENWNALRALSREVRRSKDR
ncbi:MAG: hypothetical protein MUE80_02800 [Acidobacteria bacterium]|jgi:hypothetical protein|nr:hypothetical protein [Acidobacteriota bacterium]